MDKSIFRKYKILFTIASFVFIGLPQYIDSIWSLYQKIWNMENAGLNITWLYAITAPFGLGMMIFIIWQSRKRIDYSNVAWGIYDNLEVLFRELQVTSKEKVRAEILAKIEKERGKLPDRGLDEIINLFLDAESEAIRYGMNPYDEAAQYTLRLNNERMRNYIRGKYGNRKHERNNKV